MYIQDDHELVKVTGVGAGSLGLGRRFKVRDYLRVHTSVSLL